MVSLDIDGNSNVYEGALRFLSLVFLSGTDENLIVARLKTCRDQKALIYFFQI